MTAFLTVTLNAAVDATYVVEGYRHGDANRVLRKHAMPGGKGNNVARVLAGMGEIVTATGFLGGDTGCFIDAGLRRAGIATRFGWLTSGESRTCHTILEVDTGMATEILEAGPALTDGDMDALFGALPDLVAWADVVVVSGSAPPGATPAFLEGFARIARKGADRFVVDASGAALAGLLDGGPDVLKPNEAEIRQLMGRDATLEEQIASVRHDLIGSRLGPDARVILSRGADGAILVTAGATLHARPPAVSAVNTVGCGDALLAGFVSAWAAGASDAHALRTGVAAGTAAALREVAGEVDRNDLARLRPLVEVTDDAAVA
jgi:tagatose 6-phosphate kinase